MAFIVKKKISGKEYYYLRESKRIKLEDGSYKIKAVTLAYLGKTLEEAEAKKNEFLRNNMETKKHDENNREVKLTYFVHGTTLDNEKHISSGWHDVELSEKGIKQSEELPKQIGDKKFDVVFCSDLKRAVKSAEISFSKQYKIIKDKRLRECNYGDYNAKPSEIVEPLQEKNINKGFPNGESYEDVKKRIVDFLNYLYDNYKGKHIAIVAHKAPQLAIEVLLNGKTWKEAFEQDWRKSGKWQPGWEYIIVEKIKNEDLNKNNMVEKNEKIENKYEKLMELANKKSLFYRSAEIYPNSPAGFWDFGPIGQSIRRKIVEFWRHEFVQKENMLEIHGSQILPASVFEGSGHLKSFADPIVQCSKCKKYERADKLISEKIGKNVPESLAIEKLNEMIKQNNIKCAKCNGELGKVSKFNMMVESIVGKQGEFKTFLRPEACQTIFLNFARMAKTMRLKLPQGIAQVGGAFRNEIAPRQSITRSVEFSQMEAEIYFDSEKIDEIENFDDVKNYKIRVLRLGKEEIEEVGAEELVEQKIVPGKLIAYFMARTQQVWNKMGIPLEKIRFREVDKDERAFYSLATFDFEVETSLGWLELIANNYRTDYDSKGHMEHSGTNLEYTDPQTGKKIIAHIWEVSAGVDRTMFAILDNCLKQGKEGLYISLPAKLAPYQISILPLVNKEGIPEVAEAIEKELKNAWFDVFYDASGSIGRRYARNDEIGVPFDLTVDFDSLKNKDVTLRRRDDGEQIRVKISEVKDILRKLISGELEFEKAGVKVNTRVKEE
jgi:glycyl-tRNA synthetase